MNLARLWQETTNAREREALIRALGIVGDRSPESVETLVAALKDASPRVRSAAAEVLGDLGITEAIPQLRDRMFDAYWDVQSSALIALGRLQDAESLDEIVQFSKDWDASVRAAAVEALGAIGDPQAVPALVDALEDRSVVVRNAAEAAICALGAKKVVSLLDNERAEVRAKACEVLGKLGDPQVMPHLIQALSDKCKTVRQCAAEAIARLVG